MGSEVSFRKSHCLFPKLCHKKTKQFADSEFFSNADLDNYESINEFFDVN